MHVLSSVQPEDQRRARSIYTPYITANERNSRQQLVSWTVAQLNCCSVDTSSLCKTVSRCLVHATELLLSWCKFTQWNCLTVSRASNSTAAHLTQVHSVKLSHGVSCVQLNCCLVNINLKQTEVQNAHAESAQMMCPWLSLYTLYLHACQVSVTVGDSGLFVAVLVGRVSRAN